MTAFGGDPSSITLIGESAGASMVDALLMSSAFAEEHLFHRVIISSGIGINPMFGAATKEFIQRNSQILLEVIDCSLFDINGPTLNFTKADIRAFLNMIRKNSDLKEITQSILNGTKKLANITQKLNNLKTVPADWLMRGRFLPRPFRGGELFQNATKSDFINEKSLQDRNVSILLGWASFESAFFLTSSESGGKTGKLIHKYTNGT